MDVDAPVRDDAERLLEFVRGRDVPCPQCGYSLRDLSNARCPECAEELTLRVGVATPRFGWLVAAMAPGLFSGMCATLLLVPMFAFRNAGGSGPPIPIYLAELFGFASLFVAVVIYRRRRVFMGWADRKQIGVAGAIWVVHILAFVLLIVVMNL